MQQTTGERTEENATRPLRVEHRRVPLDPPPRFAPRATLVATPALKDCGLLAALPDREARTLLAVLSQLTPDGRFEASAPAVARALGVPDRKARDRLRDLARVRWRGEPVVVEVAREQALPVWVPSPAVVSQAGPPVKEEVTPGGDPAPAAPSRRPAVPSRREEAYERSRAAYARTREEVEAQVLDLLGHGQASIMPFPDGSPEGEAFRALVSFGVTEKEARSLVSRFGPERCLRQAGWMPLRAARDPARYLAAAIEHDYAAPKGL